MKTTEDLENELNEALLEIARLRRDFKQISELCDWRGIPSHEFFSECHERLRAIRNIVG